MRRLRVQLTVLLGMLVVAWRAAIFLDASDQAEVRATESFDRVKELSRRWRGLFPVVERILSPFRAMAAKHTLRTKLPGNLPVIWGDPDRSSRY